MTGPLDNAGESTSTSYIISSDCLNCGVCEFMCPEGAIVPARNQFIINKVLCTGCAKCVPYCLVRAITPKERFAERQDRTVKAKLRRVLEET